MTFVSAGSIAMGHGDSDEQANGKRFFPMDVNADGRMDLVIRDPYGGLNIWLSSGSSFYSAGVIANGIGNNAVSSGTRYLTGDINGDGKTDYMVRDAYGTWFVWSASAPFPDLLTAITAETASVQLTYKPLTDPSVYTKDSDAVYPVVDLQIPLHTVSLAKTGNAIGGTVDASYSYKGAKGDEQGRGFLGLRRVQATRQIDGVDLEEITHFMQDWPYVGLPSKRMRRAGSLLLRQVDYTYACRDFDADPDNCTVSPGKRYFPYVSQSVETGSDLNGAALPAVTTTTAYDDGFGNATSVVVSTPDGFSKSTSNTFASDATHWILGRLTRSSIQSTAP